MKKRLLSSILCAAVVSSMLMGCGGTSQETPASGTTDTETTDTGEEPQAADSGTTSDGGAELALVTDLGTIDDKSFNQGSWEGLKKYGDENSISYKYYQPQEGTTSSYVETIGLAIEGGAKLVVCPGFLFEEPIYIVQDEYPDVTFILIDGEPHNADNSDRKTNTNVLPILFQEDQAGFLAGYAAVKEGYTNLGFMGGMAVPAVIRYGYGYIQGAEAAAKEMNVPVTLTYHYTGNFDATPEAKAMAASWYKNGTEVIFGCGGAVGNSVMAAAEEAGAKVIGVDVDQSSESETVITSAVKLLSNSVYDGVKSYYDGSFKGGATAVLTVENNGLGLSMESSKFETFTQEDYDAVYAKLAGGEFTINNSIEDGTTKDLTLEKVTVSFVE
ncbi:MAG: BMP family ABC transporter substrate-binding protein [Lachnospiraceae bacterium]|jgi:basic membrane protein A|nr:BMP family ABC transporter substrate-binding protein [Lachnospiraceae bacterium]